MSVVLIDESLNGTVPITIPLGLKTKFKKDL